LQISTAARKGPTTLKTFLVVHVRRCSSSLEHFCMLVIRNEGRVEVGNMKVSQDHLNSTRLFITN